MSLTHAEAELLYVAVGEVEQGQVWCPLPDQDKAIEAIVALPTDRLKLIISWVFSEEHLPNREDESMDCRNLITALIRSKRLTLKENLEMMVAMITHLEIDHDSIYRLFGQAAEHLELETRFATLLPQDALALFRDFLYGFKPAENPEMNRDVCMFFAPLISPMINWGPLTGVVQQLSESLLVCVENQAQFWNSLIDARLQTIDHSQLA